MVRVTILVQLLLLFVILKRSDGLQTEVSSTEDNRCLGFTYEILVLKAKLTAKEILLDANKQLEEKMQAAINDLIDDLIKTAKSNELTIQEELTQIKGKFSALSKSDEENKATIKQLREKLEHCQATIDGLNKTVEKIMQTAQLPCEQQKDANNDSLIKAVEAMKRTAELLCAQPVDACPYLLAAVMAEDVNTAKILVNCSNHKCTTDAYWHYTPLMYAAANDQLKMVRVLVEGGASVNIANDDKWTALHVAAWFGHLDMCRLLLDLGANVDVLNGWKNAPLYWAAWAGKLSVVKLLVERGAVVGHKNKEGHTASYKAREEGHSDVADWLDAQG